MHAGLWMVTAALALGGCSQAVPDKTSTDNNTAAAPATPTTGAKATPTPLPASPASEAADASRTTAKTDDYSFAYSYPAAAAAIAPLARWLNDDRAAVRADIAGQASDGRRASADGNFPFHPYESSVEWKVVTATPRFLSLSAETYEYTGGAHGSPGFRALVWDKTDGTRLAPEALFASAGALQSAIGTASCRRIDTFRAQRRGAPIERSDDPFNQCPKVSESTLILGSTDGRAIDRIGLLVPPYVAGPYAEGSYDVTLPVTPAVIAALKPAYRSGFAAR